MNMVPVSSSNLRAVGYDAASSTLYVTFNHGGTYAYSGVPASVHASLMTASSHGTYFDSHVKKAGYAFNKIG